MNIARLLFVSLCLGLVGITTGLHAEINAKKVPGKVDAGKVDFSRDIYPILQRSCFECHGPDRKSGRLRLDSREALNKGGRSGAVLVPGHADKSELIRRVLLPKDSDEVMPARGKLLAKNEIALLRRWIDGGAHWPDKVEVARHWAYVPPKRPALPDVNNKQWIRNAVDHFILARLEKEGLQPTPEADRATLIRRLSLDLIGLPPSPADVDAFIADKSPDAYEKVVDRLLASPHFGERWARPWLDLARYADSHGFQRDDLRNIWPFRDWVIRAFNADMPFDQFTIEQIAGDLLPKATMKQKVATGFHRCVPINVEAGSEPEESRVNQVFDRVNTTAAVWLGTTLECAQCHDHKYDPFTQKDYYRLFAYFNNTAIEAKRTNPKVPGSIQFMGPYTTLSGMENEPERAKLTADIEKVDAELTPLRKKLTAEVARWEAEVQGSLQDTGGIHVLEIADFESTENSEHKKLDDNSVLLVGDPPENDTYRVTVHTKLTHITGFKLETLTDPSLPGKGPGRGDAGRPNFVLYTFRVDAESPAGKKQQVKLTSARADFSQKNFDVSGAVDDDPKTAWAINPQFHKPHWAIFATKAPVGHADGTTLTFTLVQNFGGGRTIGRLRLSALTGNQRDSFIPADIATILKLPVNKRSRKQKQSVIDFRLQQDSTYARLQDKRESLEARLKKLKPPTTLTMQELPEPRKSSVFARGDYKSPGEPVLPGAPVSLVEKTSPPKGQKSTKQKPGDRLELARWLVDRDNPLTARVTVNRWWREIFGRGIVTTVEDFGIKGERPTHPELLDWLAVDFMEKGWSMKKLLRTLVTSATYRQSSRITPELLARDDLNQLYARGPRYRMDAEMIRDNALAVSGLLSEKQFGPPVKPYQPPGIWVKIGGAKVDYITSPGEDHLRRGIYTVWKRGAPYPSFVNFDATARYSCLVKRSRSNTPLQALTLLNDPVYVEAALGLARRVLTEKADADTRGKLRYAFRLCLTRQPQDREMATLERLLLAQTQNVNPKAILQLMGDFEIRPPEGVTLEEFGGWYAIGTALLNLDESISLR